MKKIPLIIFLLIIIACQPDIETLFEPENPQLVLWGFFTEGDTIQIQLSKIYAPLSNLSLEERRIDGAEVILYKNQIAIDTLADIGLGNYKSSKGTTPIAGATYHITAFKTGFPMITSLPDKMPIAPIVTDYTAKDSIKPLATTGLGTAAQHQITLNLQDPISKNYIGKKSIITKDDSTQENAFFWEKTTACEQNSITGTRGGKLDISFVKKTCLPSNEILTLKTLNPYLKGEIISATIEICYVADSFFPFLEIRGNSASSEFDDIFGGNIEAFPVGLVENGYGFFGGYNCDKVEVEF